MLFVIGFCVGLLVAWVFEVPIEKIKNRISKKREDKKHAKKDKLNKEVDK